MFKPVIEDLISKSGYKKNFIASKLNISYRQLRNYELGVAYLTMDKAYILADLLQCKVDDLYERVGEE